VREFEVVRDPLWNNIRLDGAALELLDSAPFQRLRYIRQLGHAFLVYPGATHTRFEHALGAYHLAGRALGLLGERGQLQDLPQQDAVLVRLAALLHDIGHYPFSHALEEAGLLSHEDLAAEHLAHPEVTAALGRTGIPDAGRRITELITGRSASPLQGLISGSLDLDKIDYLTRDARMCGVPYGTVDVDRLLHALTLVALPDGRRAIAVREKGASALESLTFAKYQMYRNVYWHHAVRAATAMFKRAVRAAIACQQIRVEWIAHATDEALMERLRQLEDAPLVRRLRRRRLYKRLLDLAATDVPAGAGAWIPAEPELVAAVEDRLAVELGLAPGEVLLDFPYKPDMLVVDLPLLTRRGAIEPAQLAFGPVTDALHRHARRLRIFGAEPRTLDQRAALALVERSEGEVREMLEAERALLA
jgi:uncharacterized protein